MREQHIPDTPEARRCPRNSYVNKLSESINQLQYLRAERDVEKEKLIILRDKIELKLLSTLGTKEVKIWLPYGVRKDNFYCIDQYYISVNSHRRPRPFIAGNINQPTANVHTTNCDYFPVGSICKKFEPLSSDIYWHLVNSDKKLLYLYSEINALSEEGAIEQLCELFSISKDIFTMPKLDGRTNWHQNLNNPFIPFLWNFLYMGLNSYITGNMYGGISNGKKILYPMTAWQKSADNNVRFLNIPFSGLQPLFHLDTLWINKELPVLLTDSIEIAFVNQNISDQWFICTSWYGDKEAIPHVEWKYLKNRKEVRYLLTNHSGQSAQRVFETAMAVMETLEAEGITINFEHLNLTDGPPFGQRMRTGFIFREEFIAEASRLLGNITVNIPREGVTAKNSELKTIPDEPIPDMKYILYPVIPESSITLLYADTGVGKTWLALSMAFSAALGCQTFFKWKAEKPRKVLYIDSEMDETSFQRRLKIAHVLCVCLLYTSPSPRDLSTSRMPSSA
eukprot:TRINITY_DN5379_c0_g1_i5.p1 TRINITY_DN5379_c0_g1~~TRINITY_DN5379_c0_g1_i5.p1  ORF type:complete len:508 (-),score=35.23 TRINITY_DN5379_c0_g1_i5:84-1607(-)